jgi:UDPglucose 6-dehydrogenase
MKITVIGTGYVGLVSGACLAEVGNDVLCLDLDPAKIKILEDGGIPIHEPGLQDMVRATWPPAACTSPPTWSARGAFRHHPVHRGGHAARRRRLGRHAVRAGRGPQHRPPHDRLQGGGRQEHGAGGHGRRCAPPSPRSWPRGSDMPFSVVSNPEFLKEGAAVDDFMKPDRIVVGSCDDEQAALLMRALYAPFQRNHDR